jgi:O-antigen/teichoic acid export membrane protein
MSSPDLAPGSVLTDLPWRRLGGGAFAASVGKLMTATVFAQVIGLAAAPLTARIFEPATVGINALFVHVAAILSVAACLRFDQAVPLARERHVRVATVALSLMVLGVVVAGLSVVLPMLSDQSGPAALRSLASYVWLLPLVVLLVAANQVLTSWSIREGAFGSIARSRLLQSAGQVGYQTLGGFATSGHVLVLLTGTIVGNLALLWGMARRLDASFWTQLRALRFAEVRRVAAEYRQFPIYNSWSALLDTLALALPLLAIGFLHGPREAGIFRMAFALTVLPITALSGATANVYANRAAIEVHEDVTALSRRHLRLTCVLAAIGAALILGAQLLPFIVPVLLGRQWADAGTLGTTLAVSAAFGLVVSIDNLNLLRRNRWEAMWIVGKLSLMAAAVAYVHREHLGLDAAVRLFVLTQVASYVSLFLLNRFALRQHHKSALPPIQTAASLS